ncbi:hypothetical protein WA158_003737 [Blastocystis sp. Blastoise]
MEIEGSGNASSTALVNVNVEKDQALIVKEDEEIPRTSSLPAPTMLLTGHTDAVYTLKFSPEGQHLATGGADKQILLWDVYGDCQNFGVLEGHKNAISEVCWSSDGMSLYSGAADSLVMGWDTAYCKCVRKFKGHGSFVNSIDVSKNSEELIISASDDTTCKLWDRHTNKCVKTIPHDYQVTSCCFNEDGTQIITGGLDGIIRVFDMNTFTCSLTLPPVNDIITGISAAPEGGYLLCNSMDNMLRVFDVNPFFSGTNRCVKIMRGHSHSYEKNLLKCSWAPDLSMVTCGSADSFVYVYDTTTLEIKYCLPGHKGSVNDVQFHPLEPIIGSVSSDKNIFLGEILP